MVNAIPGMKEKAYLELGIGARTTWDLIEARTKVGVDVEYKGDDCLQMTTDEYFAGPGQSASFDAVYIDAMHDYPFPLRDFNNASTRLKNGGLILLHDMFPQDLGFTDKSLCSDAYKFLGGLATTETRFRTLDSDHGLTVVFDAAPVVEGPDWARLSYEQFRQMAIPRIDGDQMEREIIEYVEANA